MSSLATPLVVLVFVAAAAPFLGDNDDVASDQRFLFGVCLAIAFLLIVGTINWIVAKVRTAPRPWWHATFSTGPLIIAFVVAVLSAAGRE